MEEVPAEVADAALADDAFVDVVAYPMGFTAVKETDLAVRIPAGVEDPAAEVLSEAGEGVGVAVGAVFLETPDFAFEILAESFVGVDGEDPIVGGLAGGVVFLTRVAAPVGFEDPGAVAQRDFDLRTVEPNRPPRFVASSAGSHHTGRLIPRCK